MGWLRFLLALNVVFFHTAHLGGTPYLLDGNAAVWMFYVISGFYMALVLNEKYSPAQRALFWSNRFWRLAPAYGVSLLLFALMWLVTGKLCSGDYCSDTAQWHSILQLDIRLLVGAVLANLAIIGQDLFWLMVWYPAGVVWTLEPSASALSGLILNMPAYTLAAEILFYALAPFIVISRRRLAVATALAGAYHLSLALSGHYVPQLYFSLSPSGLLVFFMGSWLYHLRAYWPKPASGTALWLMGITGVMLVIAVGTTTDHTLKLYVALSAAFCLIPVLFTLTATSRVDRWVGNLSYPVYILHWPVLVWIIKAQGLQDYAPLAIPLTLVLALLIMLLVDQPVDRWRQRRMPTPLPVSAKGLD